MDECTDEIGQRSVSIARRLKRLTLIAGAACLLGITLALMGHALLEMRYHHDGGNALRWLGGFLVGGIWGALVARSGGVRDRRPPRRDAGKPESPPAQQSPPTQPQPQAWHLTPQQRQVLGLVAAGLTVDAIARELCLSPTTVRAHLRDGYRRLGAHSRAEAIQRARECGDLT